MKSRWPRVCFCIPMIAVMLSESAWSQTAIPIPPGRTAANRATQRAENVEAPATSVPNVTTTQMLQQADELLALAQQVRVDTEHATQGLLAKDVKDKLKRIEKLSKRLREELAP